ncbi:hypothetical protein [Natronomonas sp. EA1]|uniref:hypothetical protein n=1 Tax=Natronomonas sp. EA1 TaxID=3421655 RepID=UPI003EB8DD61
MATEGRAARTDDPAAGSTSSGPTPWHETEREERRVDTRTGAGTWLRRRVAGVGRRLSFWLAIALPLVYVPLLLLGIPPELGVTGVGALILLNAVAVLVGHGTE